MGNTSSVVTEARPKVLAKLNAVKERARPDSALTQAMLPAFVMLEEQIRISISVEELHAWNKVVDETALDVERYFRLKEASAPRVSQQGPNQTSV